MPLAATFTPMRFDEFSSLLNAHRSVRSFEARPVDSALVDRVLHEALQGSSSSGNLNMVSVIKTFDTDRKAPVAERKTASADAAKNGYLVGIIDVSFPGVGHRRKAAREMSPCRSTTPR